MGRREDGLFVRIHLRLDDHDDEVYLWYVLRSGGSELRNGAARTLKGAKIAAAIYANKFYR